MTAASRSTEAAAALAALALGLQAEGSHLALAWVMTTLALAGVGNGIVFPSLVGASLGNVPPQETGAASGILVTAQQFAGVVGVTAIGTVFFSVAGTRPTAGDYAARPPGPSRRTCCSS